MQVELSPTTSSFDIFFPIISGTLKLMDSSDQLLWSVQVDHQLFALQKLDVTVSIFADLTSSLGMSRLVIALDKRSLVLSEGSNQMRHMYYNWFNILFLSGCIGRQVFWFFISNNKSNTFNNT